METAIIVAIITGSFSVLGTWILTRSETKKAEQKRSEAEREHAVREATEKATLAARLNSIDQKLDEHNGYAAKFGEIATALVAIQKDIEYLKKEA